MPASTAATFTAVVVLPTPPLGLCTARIIAADSVSFSIVFISVLFVNVLWVSPLTLAQ
jgi:hypothetical protein